MYNDPEDPDNPGFALYPAMGTIINDMGVYGGSSASGWPPVSVEDNFIINPINSNLLQNYPNPFNPTTTISYELPKSTYVKLSIYDITGRLVETLVNEHKNAGYYSVNWNAANVSSGIYFYRIDAGEFRSVRKCLVVK